MGDSTPRDAGAPASRTRRQEIAQLLRERDYGFDELRALFALSRRELEEELRHVERSARRGAGRFRVAPSRCRACGFEFRDRAARHLHPPGRCPRCRSERIDEPRFRIDDGEGRPRGR